MGAISKITINLWIINFVCSVVIYAFAQGNVLPSFYIAPDSNTISNMISRYQVGNVEVDPTMLLGDFITALRLIVSMLTGEALGFLLGLASTQWVTYLVQGIYTLSSSLLIIKLISNRLID